MAASRVGTFGQDTFLCTRCITIERLNRALNDVQAHPEVVARFESHGARAEPGGADALANTMQRDLDRWRKVVAQARIAPKESPQLALD